MPSWNFEDGGKYCLGRLEGCIVEPNAASSDAEPKGKLKRNAAEAGPGAASKPVSSEPYAGLVVGLFLAPVTETEFRKNLFSSLVRALIRRSIRVSLILFMRCSSPATSWRLSCSFSAGRSIFLEFSDVFHPHLRFICLTVKSTS